MKSCTLLPWQEEVVKMFEDSLDIKVGLFNDGLWYGVSW